MTSRLKWVKGMLKVVIQTSRIYYGRSDRRGLKGSSQSMRSLEEDLGKGSSWSNSNGERRRVASAYGSATHLDNGRALKETVASLINRLNQGITIMLNDYVDVLRGCFKQRDLESVKQVHECIKKSGLEQDAYLANNLLKCYIGCRRLQNAQELFNKFDNKDIVSWNLMIGGYAEHNFVEAAIEVYNQLRNEGPLPNAITYLTVLKACASPKALPWGKEIHADIVYGGFQADVRVCNALLHMFAKCDSIEDARSCFDRMDTRNVISWNAIIGGLAQHGQVHEALTLLHQMHGKGCTPDSTTYLSILRTSPDRMDLRWLKEVHSHLKNSGVPQSLRVNTALIHMYAKCGSVDDARAVFDTMVERDTVTWNAMIGGLAQHGHGQEAFSLFDQMHREGFLPNSATYLCILSAKADPENLAWVTEVHSHATRSGFAHDLRVNNALLHMYAKCGSMDDAKLVFDSMINRDVISWTAMIGALAQNGCGHEAFSHFQQMQREGVAPNAATYLSILNSNACEGALAWVKEIQSHAERSGLNADLRVGNALVHMYAKSGSIEDARAVFSRMEDRDDYSWNVMIGGLAQHGLGHEAFSLLLQMEREGFKVDALTCLCILNPVSSPGALEWVKKVHAHAMKVGLDLDFRVKNALVHMYAKIGSITDARDVFDKMLDRDIISWTTMIGALAQHGHGREALRLYEEMKIEGVKPNGPSFVAVLSACSHAGFVDEGRFQFAAMRRDYGIEHALKHYTCMADILGRAGHLEEAKLLIFHMPIEPDVVTWKAFLGACRIYNNTKLAELAAKECLKLEPMNPSTYVLLSNIYAIVGNWDQASVVRSMMQERGLRKDPGRCWIEVDNKIHHFVSGDRSHPEAREIFAMLSSLSDRLKTEGYTPDSRLVLHSTDEEEKESALFFHSEKLAMAYGLMHLTCEKPIRIYKNLRMCLDCHTASKFISKVTGREIIARDANRFHNFRDGVCSCGDYW